MSSTRNCASAMHELSTLRLYPSSHWTIILIAKHMIKDDFPFLERLPPCDQIPWPTAQLRVIADHIDGLFLLMQIENDESREDRNGSHHAANSLCSLKDTHRQYGSCPKQIDNIFLSHNDRAGGEVQVGRDLTKGCFPSTATVIVCWIILYSIKPQLVDFKRQSARKQIGKMAYLLEAEMMICNLWVSALQPINRFHLNAPRPDIPMRV